MKLVSTTIVLINFISTKFLLLNPHINTCTNFFKVVCNRYLNIKKKFFTFVLYTAKVNIDLIEYPIFRQIYISIIYIYYI